MTRRRPAGNHAGVIIPLEAGSAVAGVVYRLWAGQAVVTYPSGEDWLDVPIEVARQLSLHRDSALVVSIVVPGTLCARWTTWRLLRRLRSDPHRGVAYRPTQGSPDRSWPMSPLHPLRRRYRRTFASDTTDPAARLQVLTPADNREGAKVPRITVLHPRLSPVAARAACYRPRAGQVLVPDTWPHLADHGLATSGNDWGEMPVEILLAGTGD